MKRYLIFSVLFLGCLFILNAQDLIVLRDGNIIEAIVVEVSPTEIRYRRFDHQDGPIYVVLAINVLSIRYANGRTEIINTTTQPETTIPNVFTQQTNNQEVSQFDNSARLNSLGLSIGYLGVSSIGGIFNWNVSPSQFTFFNINMGLGFSNFSFSGNVSFNAFVPFNIGGWYGGLGLGGGMYQFANSMDGFFAINAITGLILFNWLNISATLQMEVLPELDIRFQPMVGYIHRFGTQESSAVEIEERQAREPRPPREPREPRPPREPLFPRELQDRKNWLSIDASFIGGGLRYDRNITQNFSLGLGYFVNYVHDFTNEESLSQFLFLAARLYPGFSTFYFELGIGFGDVWREGNNFRYADGFMMMPAIGFRFGGYNRSFFVNPFISVPMAFGKYVTHPELDQMKRIGGVLAQIRAGIGFGFAW